MNLRFVYPPLDPIRLSNGIGLNAILAVARAGPEGRDRERAGVPGRGAEGVRIRRAGRAGGARGGVRVRHRGRQEGPAGAPAGGRQPVGLRRPPHLPFPGRRRRHGARRDQAGREGQRRRTYPAALPARRAHGALDPERRRRQACLAGKSTSSFCKKFEIDENGRGTPELIEFACRWSNSERHVNVNWDRNPVRRVD